MHPGASLPRGRRMTALDAQPSSADQVREFSLYISLDGEASEEDEHIARWHVLTMALTKPVSSVEQLDEGFWGNLWDATLTAFHDQVAISAPDNFTISVYLPDGRMLDLTTQKSALKDVGFSLKSGPVPVPDDKLPVRIDFVSTINYDDQDRRLELVEKYAKELIAPGAWGACMFNKVAMHGEAHVCRALIEKGADIRALDEHGRAPIHSACCFKALSIGSVGVLNALIEAGAPVNQRDRAGKQALHYAAHQGDSRASAFLIEHGAQLDRLDNNGLAPIHLAVKNSDTKVLRTLVQAGADIEQRNAKGHTAVEMLLGEKRTKHHIGGTGKCALWLITRGASVPSQGSMPIGVKTSIVNQLEDLTPTMAAVLGEFLPELTELLEGDHRNPTSDDELERLRVCAQEMNFNEAVALIDSHKARSVIDQVIAHARQSAPGAH